MSGDAIALGPGKAALLEQIDALGSIAAAGRALGLSYRRTRNMVDTLNVCWREPLVRATKGGTNGGGAALTPLGQELLAAYDRLACDLQDVAKRHETTLLGLLAEVQADPA